MTIRIMKDIDTNNTEEGWFEIQNYCKSLKPDVLEKFFNDSPLESEEPPLLLVAVPLEFSVPTLKSSWNWREDSESKWRRFIWRQNSYRRKDLTWSTGDFRSLDP